MTRSDLVNLLIEKFKYTRYLEIGLDKGQTFNTVKCKSKESVDPAEGIYSEAIPTYKMTSDDFFENNAKSLEKWDIIFIDGLHHSEQVDKDIKNAVKYLNEGGSIVLHDCSPTSEIAQIIPRKVGIWNGDVWKSVVKYRNEDNELGCIVINSDYGLGFIHKSVKLNDKFKFELTYNSLDNNRVKYLGLIETEDFINNYIIDN